MFQDPERNGEILIFNKQIYHCGPCKLCIATETEYREHLETHAYDCLYRCLYCSALSPCSSSLTDHIATEHPGKEKYYGCLVFPTTDQILQVLHSSKETLERLSFSEMGDKQEPKESEGVSTKDQDETATSQTGNAKIKASQDLPVGPYIEMDLNILERGMSSDDDTQAAEGINYKDPGTVGKMSSASVSHSGNDAERGQSKAQTFMKMLMSTSKSESQDASPRAESKEKISSLEDIQAKSPKLTSQDDVADSCPKSPPTNDNEGMGHQILSEDIKPDIGQGQMSKEATANTSPEPTSETTESHQSQGLAPDKLNHSPTSKNEDSDTSLNLVLDDDSPESSPRPKQEHKGSDNEEPTDSHLPASPIQLSDNDSDIEITGESKTISKNKNLQQRALESYDAKGDAFKTSLQCVYSKGKYVCKSCSQVSRNYIQFAQHLYKHLHASDDQGGHNCPYCSKDAYAILKPLSCSLVTKLMGILQRQKKAQEIARQPPPLQGPFTYSDSVKTPSTPTNPTSLVHNLPHLHPAKSISSIEPLVQEDTPSSPIIIEPGAESGGPPTPIVIEPTGESAQLDTPDARVQRRGMSSSSYGSFPSESGSSVTSSAEIGSITPTTPKESNKGAKYYKGTSRVLLQRKPEVTCQYTDNHFVCDRCKYSVHHSRPKVFRRHLWYEVHPTKTCDHCPESVKFNRFMACPVINGIMSGLLEAKEKEGGEQSREENESKGNEQLEDQPMEIQGGENNIKRQLSSEGDASNDSLLDVVNSDGGPSNNAGMQKHDNLEITSVEGSAKSISTQDKKALMSTDGNVTDVVAMIQDLNENIDGESESQPEVQGKEEDGGKSQGIKSPEETLCKLPDVSQGHDNLGEDNGNMSTEMFVISSVISQADDVDEENRLQIDTGDGVNICEQSAAGEDSRLPKNTDDTQAETLTATARPKEDSEQKADTSAESSTDAACTSDKGASTEKTTNEETDDNSTTSGLPVSRILPYSWDKSRKVEKQPPTQSPSLQSDSVYTCSFYKCTSWGTRDSSAFKIHNLLHHAEARNFACPYCMRTFATDEYLMQHIDKSHTESRLFIHFRNYHCGIKGCSAAFEREEEFLSHNDMFHPDAVSFSCSFCQKEFPFDKELAVHIEESIMYTTTLQPFISRTKYKDILQEVHAVINDRPEPVDSFIQLHLTCATQSSNGEKVFVTINRCVDNYRPLQNPDLAAEQETFKCTNCSLVTSDEDYFEAHVTYCQKYPLLKPRPASPPSVTPAALYSGPDRNSVAIINDTEAYQEMQWEKEPTEAYGSGQVKAGGKPRNPDGPVGMIEGIDEESESLPELEPPVLHPEAPPPKRKGVLQSLGKGSAVVCEKCTFKTEFRVVKAIHDRIHQYSQDKSNMLWCPHCPYSTDIVLHLKVHVQGHSEKSRIRLYNCSSCPFSSNQLDMVEDHHEDVHEDQELKSEVTRLVLDDLQCFECPLVLKTEIDLLEHFESFHSHDVVQKYLKDMYSIASLQIVEENEEAKQSTQVKETVKYPPESKSIFQRVVTEAEEDRELGSDRFQCPHCNYSCYKCGSWVRHMQRHNTAGNQEIVMYCCKTCKWKSTSKRKTIDHCKQRHNEIILEVQTMEFSTLKATPSAGDEIGEDKEEAQGRLAGISRYHCDFCDYSTNEKAVLVEHWKIHEGQTASATLDNEEEDEDYEEYARAYSGAGHQYAQEEIDVNVNGDTLGLIEDSLLQLQDDERKPSKQPIQCPICPYSTDLRKCMRRHLIFHKKQAGITNGFKCSYCPYTSELEGVVTRHINKHHPDLPVKKIIIGQPKMKDEEQYARDSLNIVSKALGNVSEDNKQRVFKTAQTCPHCDYTTKLHYNLVQHMRIHTQASNMGMTEVDTDGEDSTPGFTIAAVIGSDGSTDMIVREGGQVTRHIKNTERTGRPEGATESVTTSGDSIVDRETEERCQSLFCSKVEGKSLYRCKICVFMDKDPAKIYHHFCTRHKDHCPFRCGYCAYQSVAAVKIQQHCKINHGGLPVKLTNVGESNSQEAMTSPESGSRTVTADLIEDESTLDDECREQAYDEWISTFMIKCGNNVQMCNACGYEQKGTAALKRHVLAVHLRYYPYKCKHCAFSAVEANKILKHTDKNHPDLERKIIRRKIPDELPTPADGDDTKEQLNVSTEQTEDGFPGMLNVNIKQEPREYSSPEPEAGNEGLSDNDQPSGYSTPDGHNHHFESIQIKKEPGDDYSESTGHTPVKVSRRQKYPKQYVKTYKCTECSYISKWNLADVKHHVLTVHLKIHSYSCQYCCFGSPKRGKLEEHYSDYHPTITVNPDETREDIHSALSIIEQGDDVFIGLGDNASVIERRYPTNVKPRTPKPPGANVGGRQRSSSPRHSSPAGGVSSPHSDHSSASTNRISAARGAPGSAEQPLDLSYRATPPPMRRSLIPAHKSHSTLRIPTITKPYPFSYESSPSPARPVKKKKKDYTLYKCSSCGRGYVQKIKAQYHFALKHLNLHPYICNYCSFGEDARKRVVDHIVKEHPYKEVVVFPAFREHALVQEKVYPVKVDLSEYEGAMRAVKYINDSGMLHQREKSEKCTVRCPQCSIMLPGLNNLDDHMASTHQDYTGFKCSYCGVYVKAKQKMRYHLTHKHPDVPPKYQPIKEGVPFGNPLSTFDEIVRKKSQFVGQRKPPSAGLTVAFPFYRPKQEKIGFANISKKRLSARCSRGYRENTGNLVEDITLQMRVPTQPTPEEVTVEGRPPPKMIKPRSDVVGGTVWLLCNHCQYTTLTSTLMRHHVMSHINYRPFRCSYCSFNGVRSHQVKKHMISMHRKLPPIVKYRTDATVEASLTDHFTMKVRRGNANDNQGKPMWMQQGHSHSSVVNKKVNARRTGGDDHVPLKKIKLEKQASEEREEQLPVDESRAGEVGARRPEEYLCVLCGFRRPSRSSLLRHIMWELDYRPWSCPHCEYKDVTLFGVKRHCFQSHPNEPFKMVLKQNPERMSKIQALVEQSKMNSGSSERSTPSATVTKQDSGESSEKSLGNETFGSYPYSGQTGPNHGQNVYEAGMMMAMPSDNTVVTSAEQLEAQEEQYASDPHIYRCKHCTFQSPDKTCFKKHILRHGPKRFQCGYCSYCAVFKAELHRHMNRLHKRKPYKIISLSDNQVVTSKVKTKTVPMPVVQPDFSRAPTHSSSARTLVGLSVDAKAEGGLLAQLEAELHDMKPEGDSGSDTEPEPAAGAPTPSPKRKIKEENGGNQEPFAVLDGVVLTEEHLAMNAAGEYQCQFCNLSSPHREKARTHLAKHFQLRWKCGICDMKHQLSYEMRRHIRHKHPGMPIKMLRLETDADFVSKSSPPPQSSRDKVSISSTKSNSSYSKPGPACSKRLRPSPSNVPSVFCCFLCTFKTNNTLELVEHQRMHAEADKMPKLSPEEPIVTSVDVKKVLKTPHSYTQNSSVSETNEDLDARGTSVYVRPFKCGYCEFSGFLRDKVKNHCLQIHKDKAVYILDQRPNVRDSMIGDSVVQGSQGMSLSVVADDVLIMAHPKLEHLLKTNNVKGIRW